MIMDDFSLSSLLDDDMDDDVTLLLLISSPFTWILLLYHLAVVDIRFDCILS